MRAPNSVRKIQQKNTVQLYYPAPVVTLRSSFVATEEEKEGWGSFDTRALDPERRAELQVRPLAQLTTAEHPPAGPCCLLRSLPTASLLQG